MVDFVRTRETPAEDITLQDILQGYEDWFTMRDAPDVYQRQLAEREAMKRQIEEQKFREAEAAKERLFRTGEREAGQEFTAEQAEERFGEEKEKLGIQHGYQKDIQGTYWPLEQLKNTLSKSTLPDEQKASMYQEAVDSYAKGMTNPIAGFEKGADGHVYARRKDGTLDMSKSYGSAYGWITRTDMPGARYYVDRLSGRTLISYEPYKVTSGEVKNIISPDFALKGVKPGLNSLAINIDDDKADEFNLYQYPYLHIKVAPKLDPETGKVIGYMSYAETVEVVRQLFGDNSLEINFWPVAEEHQRVDPSWAQKGLNYPRGWLGMETKQPYYVLAIRNFKFIGKSYPGASPAKEYRENYEFPNPLGKGAGGSMGDQYPQVPRGSAFEDTETGMRLVKLHDGTVEQYDPANPRHKIIKTK